MSKDTILDPALLAQLQVISQSVNELGSHAVDRLQELERELRRANVKIEVHGNFFVVPKDRRQVRLFWKPIKGLSVHFSNGPVAWQDCDREVIVEAAKHADTFLGQVIARLESTALVDAADPADSLAVAIKLVMDLGAGGV